MLQFLCENAEKQNIKVDLTSIFTFIGMAFCIIVAVVALVWLTCFMVRLLIKTFKTQVQNSYDIFVENSSAKTKSKKERNAIKRQAKDARKMEILNLKQESQDRIHKMKVEKLGAKLSEVEERAKEKYGVENVQEENFEPKVEIKKQDKENDLEEVVSENNVVDNDIVEETIKEEVVENQKGSKKKK